MRATGTTKHENCNENGCVGRHKRKRHRERGAERMGPEEGEGDGKVLQRAPHTDGEAHAAPRGGKGGLGHCAHDDQAERSQAVAAAVAAASAPPARCGAGPSFNVGFDISIYIFSRGLR